MTSTKLPYLHKNARSRQITSREVREVFADEVTRGMPRGMDREEYLRSVMA
ncbi:hypothetical protein Pukovnik_54 [Mycobacterium phage Pukovnik]|uniref:Uncharacterized protein n=1 Tax=Mycobacterium phage Pukovnik TaxID=2914013 RepID=B3VGK3_9CAUD|nr:hypothetical protein Pukovnik_54 [Mycobacterium phage Pukovnik]ACE79980.1 hypothetical protein Pukovnik_54 [Mycobacterium phage Pukovnik]